MKNQDKPLESPADVPEPETKRRGGGKPFRSKLEPFFEEIKAARKARKTWAEIADQLKDRVETTPQGIHYFFKSKRRKKYALGMEPDEPAPAQPGAIGKPEPPAATGFEPDIYDQAVEALKQKEQQPNKGVSHFPPGTII